MPELPEVETTRCGLQPHVEGFIIQRAVVRHLRLRWPVPSDLNEFVSQQTISHIARRGKYLLFYLSHGAFIIHLGMSGSLRIVPSDTPASRHDHVDFVLSNDQSIRYHDPRRFGSIHTTHNDPLTHPLLQRLGVEPLSASFNADYLKTLAGQRTRPVKTFIMDSHVVTGVGNIYATEALFMAKIHPATPVNLLQIEQFDVLIQAIQCVLQAAILQGGTTLKDFVNTEGKPGYFVQSLQAYGRAGLACLCCGTTLQAMALAQRRTVFCITCQPLVGN